LTFCIRRGIENFLNFQVVFDLIIQKKIWPAQQRLFTILRCKTKKIGTGVHVHHNSLVHHCVEEHVDSHIEIASSWGPEISS
jgi:hypothetical protein